jgi:NAD-dependent dihydropyrimidine dehydrogenase PreA subunit
MSKDPAKTKRAAADPKRPGRECKAEPGTLHPEVDPRRCEGKSDCVAVCPYDVFEVGRMADATFDAMPLLVKLKIWAHGKKTAFTPRADACRACGLCVVACPEHAIRLVGPAAGTG